MSETITNIGLVTMGLGSITTMVGSTANLLRLHLTPDITCQQVLGKEVVKVPLQPKTKFPQGISLFKPNPAIKASPIEIPGYNYIPSHWGKRFDWIALAGAAATVLGVGIFAFGLPSLFNNN